VRRTAIAAGIALALASVAGGVAFRVTRIHGFITGLAPVDGGRAVVTMRANAEWGQPPRAWIGLLDASGGWLWSRRLPGLPVVGPRRGLLVDDGLAIVRTDGAPGATAAYAVADGKLAWSASVEHNRPDGYLDLAAAGGRVVQGSSGGPPGEEIVAFDRVTGERRWRAEIGDVMALRSPQVVGATLVVESVFITVRVSLETGQVHRAPGLGPGCVVNDESFTIESTREGYRVIATAGTATRVVVPTVELDLPSAGALQVPYCGRRGDRLVFTVDPGTGTRLRLIEVDPAAGRQVRAAWLELDGALHHPVQETADLRFPEAAPLAGALPRFVPVPLFIAASALAVIDLDTLSVARRGPPSPETRFTHVVHDGDAFYFATRDEVGSGGTLARFDGRSGRFTAAVRSAYATELASLQLRAGRIWVFGERWVDPLPYAVLDAETLAPVHVSGPKIEEALAATQKAWLGAP
jgi:hypothetical protein